MVRFIGKCGVCKKTTARDYTESERRTVGTGIYRRETNVYGRTIAGRFVRAVADFECGTCYAPRWDGKRVEGSVTAHVCNEKCTDAKGFRCECSCGGANHGRSFL